MRDTTITTSACCRSLSINTPFNTTAKKQPTQSLKLKELYLACLFLSGLINIGIVNAQVIGPVSGNQHFSNDTTISLANSYTGTGAVTANSGETITANAGTTINIEVVSEPVSSMLGNFGLVTNNGVIDLSNSKVVITNSGSNLPKLTTGIQANGGTVKIGDNSEIYALKPSAGIAVAANNNSTVEIGKNAILQGTIFSGATITGSGANANITIGEGASIVNDGTGDTNGFHRAVYAMSGARIEIGDNSTVETKSGATTSSNHGVQAGELGHTGTIVMGENITVSTQGENSYGVFAYTTGSSITGGKTAITTTGDKGYGIAAANGAVVNLGAGSSVTTSGQAGHGINAQSNGQVSLGNNSSITTSGNSTLGVSSHSGSVVTLGNNMTINTSGATAYGMQSDGTGSKINIGNNFIFESTNTGSRGIQTRRGGEVKVGDDASITTRAANSWGMNSNGDTNFNSLVTTGLRTTIVTTGTNGHGVGANNNGRLVLGNDATIDVSGDGAMGAFVTGTNATVTTGERANITTNGIGGKGAYGTNAGTINIGQASTITTTNQQALGIHSTGNNTTINTGLKVTINTTGDDAYGVYADNGGAVSLGNNNRVTTTGAATHSLVAQANSQITMGNDGFIVTDKDASHAVLALGANANISLGSNATINTKGINNTNNVYATAGGNITLAGATITNAGSQTSNSYAIYAKDANSYVNGSTAGVYKITGDINSSANGQIDLNMATGSLWTGASYLDSNSTTNLTMANSNWAMTGNSQLTSLTSQNSTVNFQSALGNYYRLSTGSLAGNGIFAMKVDMENTQGDLVQVTNANVTGSHRLAIANVGSANTTGNEVLTVVETLDNTQGAFTANTVEAGAYQYQLRRANNGRDWELFGAGLRRTTTADASVNVFSTNYLLSYIDNQTLMQRLGELRRTENHQGDFWLKGFAGKLNSFGGNAVSGFDMNYKGTQAGIDKRIDTNAGRLFVGGMVGFTDADPNYRGGNGTTKDIHFGLYSTYLTDDDFYIDGIVKYTEMRNRFNVKDTLGNTVTGKGNSKGYSASLEIGKRFYLSGLKQAGGYYIEPQAQVTYGYQGGMTINGSNGLKTKLSDYNYTLGRASAIVGYSIEGANPIDVYFKTGYVREFDGNTSYRFNQANKINHSFKGGWWDNGIGINAQINSKHNIYADINYASGSKFDQKQLNLGYRYSF